LLEWVANLPALAVGSSYSFHCWLRKRLRTKLEQQLPKPGVVEQYLDMADNSWSLRDLFKVMHNGVKRFSARTVLRSFPEASFLKTMAQSNYQLFSEAVSILAFHADARLSYRGVFSVYASGKLPLKFHGRHLGPGTRWFFAKEILASIGLRNTRDFALDAIEKALTGVEADLISRMDHPLLSSDIASVTILGGYEYAHVAQQY
jgi:hypothetical protein